MSSVDENSSNRSDSSNVINTNPKTQEFNTITSSNGTTFQLESSPLNYTGSFPSSLPFFISPETQNSAAAFIYQPMSMPIPVPMVPLPFAATPEQVQQYLYMLQQRQTSLTASNKRVKLTTSTATDSDNSLKEELNDFKETLKKSFEKNLKKLEVLDRLVQTVTVKGNFQVENVKNAMEILSNSKELLKQMILEQVNFTATATLNLKQELLSILKTSFASSSSSSRSSELQLRKEEDSHLTDLTILSSRNKELQRESRNVKEQLEKLQLEYSEALKTSFKDNEDHKNFKQSLLVLLKEGDNRASSHYCDSHCDSSHCDTGYCDTGSCVVSSVEMLLKENEGLKGTLLETRNAVETILKSYKSIKEDVTSNVVDVDTFCFYEQLSSVIIEGLYEKFEKVLYFRERFYNSKIEELKLKYENLIKLQTNLTHKSLNIKIGLSSQLADSHENLKRQRKHCDSLGSDLDRKEIENFELKRKNEVLMEKLKTFEKEISIKNQENRTFSIKIQKLESELEENSTKHRHDISALERKISILESKQATIIKKEDLADDPFSSLGAHRESNINDNINDHDVSVVIPPTLVVEKQIIQKSLVITFTGIRDSQKQKEMTKWLKDLGATVHVGADFNDDITHVLAPRGYKSIRVLAASLTGKWIVPCEWVEACHRTNQFVSENLHGGYLNTSIRPFRFRTIWLSAAFAATHKAHPIYPVAALRVLLEKLGKARWCESAGQADFLLVTDEEKESKLIGSSRGVLLTLNNVINMIPIE